MTFNDTTDKLGLIQDCETVLGMADADISGDATTLKVFTRLINAWYRRVNSWVWESTGTWEYDDSKHTDLPIATSNLVAAQQDYEIPSTAQKIDRVEILDSNGNYAVLKQIDKSQIGDMSMSEYMETNGMPGEYDLVGRSLLLYPAPAAANVTTTKGLKIYFTRDIDEFVHGDTTDEPGFVNNFHRILSLGASYDYAASYNMPQKLTYLKGQINELVEELKSFYGTRNRDMKTRISPKRRNYE